MLATHNTSGFRIIINNTTTKFDKPPQLNKLHKKNVFNGSWNQATIRHDITISEVSTYIWPLILTGTSFSFFLRELIMISTRVYCTNYNGSIYKNHTLVMVLCTNISLMCVCCVFLGENRLIISTSTPFVTTNASEVNPKAKKKNQNTERTLI